MDAGGIAELIFAGRWIAGPTVESALRRSRHLNEHKINTIINYLGEDLRQVSQVKEAMATYTELIPRLRGARHMSSVSVKLTQLGLSINRSLAEQNYVQLMNKARRHGIFLWMDMESYMNVQPTIDIYMKQRSKKGIGICIQTHLRRSAEDVHRIAKAGGTIRLVKGAYAEDTSIAYPTRAGTTANYLTLMQYLFKNAKDFTVATHDGAMIDQARKWSAKYGKKPQYAMLNGIRNTYAQELAGEEERIALYVPFGRQWVPYAYRRLQESSARSLILRSLFQRQAMK